MSSGLRKIIAVARREFVSYFVTPIGYVVMSVYTAITGVGFLYLFFWYMRASQSPADYDFTSVPDLEEMMVSPFLTFCGNMMIFIGPMITMRLLAEEKNRGSMELLLTYPLRDCEIIFGKYLAALALAVVMLVPVSVDLALVGWVTTVEPAVLIFGMVVVLMMSAAFMSVGLFISALARNQITAAIVSFGVVFVSWILGSVGANLPEGNPAPSDWPDRARQAIGFLYGIFRSFVLELPIDAHARSMTQGVVQAEDVAYYVLFTLFFIFLTFRAMESRNWRTPV